MRNVARWVCNYDDPKSIASRLRANRLAWLIAEIDEAFQRRGAVRVLDVGGRVNYWQILPVGYLESRQVAVVLANIEPVPETLDDPTFSYVQCDACEMACFGDGEFDIAHSNSVIEHVGDWSRMERFAAEVRRVSRRHVVQTPNYWFPVEPHCFTPFFHWLPEPIRVRLVRKFELGHWQRARSIAEAVEIVRSAQLLTKEMMASLFPGDMLHRERILGLTKSFVAVGGDA